MRRGSDKSFLTNNDDFEQINTLYFFNTSKSYENVLVWNIFNCSFNLKTVKNSWISTNRLLGSYWTASTWYASPWLRRFKNPDLPQILQNVEHILNYQRKSSYHSWYPRYSRVEKIGPLKMIFSYGLVCMYSTFPHFHRSPEELSNGMWCKKNKIRIE